MFRPLARLGNIFGGVRLYHFGGWLPYRHGTHELFQIVGSATGLEPVRHVALRRQIGQLQDAKLGGDTMEGLSDILSVLASGVIVIWEDDDTSTSEGF